MGLRFRADNNESDLSEEEKEGLKIRNIATREELDEFEQNNIEKAHIWLLDKKLARKDIMSEKLIRGLHARMFGEVWSWAGEFRKADKNIGLVPWYQVAIEIRKMIDDGNYWIDNQIFPEDEIAVRLHRNLVWIHPFPNGNGRLCRLWADLIRERIFGRTPFSWGGQDLRIENKDREEYIEALHEADKGDFEKLIKFAKS